MSRKVVDVDPRDIDSHNLLVERPFYLWLAGRENLWILAADLTVYLNETLPGGFNTDTHCLNAITLASFRYTFNKAFYDHGRKDNG